jgi:hypothetical protein
MFLFGFAVSCVKGEWLHFGQDDPSLLLKPDTQLAICTWVPAATDHSQDSHIRASQQTVLYAETLKALQLVHFSFSGTLSRSSVLRTCQHRCCAPTAIESVPQDFHQGWIQYNCRHVGRMAVRMEVAQVSRENAALRKYKREAGVIKRHEVSGGSETRLPAETPRTE